MIVLNRSQTPTSEFLSCVDCRDDNGYIFGRYICWVLRQGDWAVGGICEKTDDIPEVSVEPNNPKWDDWLVSCLFVADAALNGRCKKILTNWEFIRC